MRPGRVSRGVPVERAGGVGRRDGSAAARSILCRDTEPPGVPRAPCSRAPRPDPARVARRYVPGFRVGTAATGGARPHGRRTTDQACRRQGPRRPPGRAFRVPGGGLAAPVGPPAGGGRGVGPAMPPLSSRPHAAALLRYISYSYAYRTARRSRRRPEGAEPQPAAEDPGAPRGAGDRDRRAGHDSLPRIHVRVTKRARRATEIELSAALTLTVQRPPQQHPGQTKPPTHARQQAHTRRGIRTGAQSPRYV